MRDVVAYYAKLIEYFNSQAKTGRGRPKKDRKQVSGTLKTTCK